MLKSHYDIQPQCPKQEPDDDDAGAFFYGLFLALLPCSRFISSICNGVTAALRLREALQPAIELINSLYYFTQINTPAVIST